MAFLIQRGLTALIVAALAAAPVQAEVIAQYNFTGQPGNQASQAVATTAPGVTAGDIIRGPGLVPNAGATSINSNSWTLGGTIANAITNNDYYSFTINFGSTVFNLTTLDYNQQVSSTGPSTINLLTSIGGFVDTAVVASFASTSGPISVNLSSLTGVTGTVEFRLYGFGATNTAGTYRLGQPANPLFTLNGDRVPQNGSDAIPEPSTLVLAGVIGLGVAVRLRNRNRLDHNAA